MDPKDDVDVETLQAQIDMTMSFAHNLVTSWIKPAHRAQLSSNSVNATQILEEELRRPPRLGAGASISMASPLVHEASKLRRRLVKNGAKNEVAVKSRPEDSFKSDDEEHKGRPTKRKTKVDPFGPEGNKKKRKANPEANRCLSVDTVTKQSVSPLENSILGEKKHKPSSRKEKQEIEPDDHRTREPQSATAMRRSALPIFSSSPTAHATSSLSTPSQKRHATPGSSRIHATSISIPDKANPLSISLLNLDGPPELTDEPGNPSGSSNSRRKRKRRKRKKTQAIASTADSLH